MQAEPPSTYSLLLGLLEPQPTRPSRLQRLLPSSGTLPQLNQPGAPGLRLLLPWVTGLRSLAQVIFINNPLSGAVLLLAFLLESPRLALLAVVGAEYVLRLLPRGTHDYAKLIRPSELARFCREAGLDAGGITGMSYNPLSGRYWLGTDTDVNYLMHAVKPA